MKLFIYSLLITITWFPVSTAMGKSPLSAYVTDLTSADIVYNWSTNSTELKCLCFKPNSSEMSKLVVYRQVKGKMKRIFVAETGGFPFSIQNVNGNIVTVWETATGYLIYTFGYQNGMVIEYFHDGSYIQPEFAYLGSSQNRSIIVSKFDWVVDPKTNDRTRVPISANIYTWAGKSYTKHEVVQWEKRLKSPGGN